MRTEVLPVDPLRPDPAAVARASEVLRRGGLVAFPTETVYGLGAAALDPAAVRRIFTAKGRPASNPLIVHVAEPGPHDLAAAWPAAAARLAERFWPGPLTLVLPRTERVPDVVTAGGPTVALRLPAHPVALALLRAASVPVAAPSANRSTRLSPTLAAHVLDGLDGRIDMILDAGPTAGGLESTVLDLTTDPPRLLRPGLVAPAAIEAVIGPVARSASAETVGPLPSPGMLGRHYAPRTPVELSTDGARRAEELAAAGRRVGWLTTAGGHAPPGVQKVELPAQSAAYAAVLYATLHALDAAGLDAVVVDEPPAGEDWLAVRDRLHRASQAAHHGTSEPS